MKTFVKENWFKISVIAILLVIGLTVAFYLLVSIPKKEAVAIEAQKQPLEFQKKQADEQAAQQQSSNPDLQAKCSEAALSFFNNLGNTWQAGYTNHHTKNYTNYYNNSLQKCFLLLSDTEIDQGALNEAIEMIDTKTLFDVYENKVYAKSEHFRYFSSNSELYTFDYPLTNEGGVCTPNALSKYCNDAQTKFDSSIKKYMEN